MKVFVVCERFEMMFGEDSLWKDTADGILQLHVGENPGHYEFYIGLKNHPEPRE